MEHLSEYTRRLKERVNIMDVAGRLGLHPNSSGHALCFLHSDKDPSLHFTQNGSEGYYFCFGCKRGGDAISLVEERQKSSFRDACDWLAHEYGLEPLSVLRKNLPADEYDVEIARLARIRRERQTVEAVLTEAATYFHSQLPEYLRENILKAKTPPPQIDVKDPVHRLHVIHKWLAEGLPKPDIAYRLGISTRRLYQILEEYVQGDVKLNFGISQESGDSFPLIHQESQEIAQTREAASPEGSEGVKSLPGLEGEMGVGCEGEIALDPLDCEVMGEPETIPTITVYGFDDIIIHDLLIGYASPGNGLVHHLRAQGFTDDNIALSGLCLRDKTGRLRPFFQGRLMFPYWKHGRVVYFIGRKTWYTPENQWEQGKYKKLLTRSDKRPYISETVSNEHFYNEDAAHGADEVLITEGVTDCIAALQAGIPCISPVTVQFRDRDVPRLLDLTKPAKRLYLCNDVEPNHAGEKGAIRTALKLEAAGRSVFLVTLPAQGAKADLNSYFLSHSADDFRTLMQAAEPTLDYLLRTLPGLTTEDEKGERVQHITELLALARYKLRVDETFEALKKAQPKLKREDFRKEIARLRKEHIARLRSKESDLPDIQVNNRQVADIVSDAWKAMHAWNKPPQVFLREGFPVRLMPFVSTRGKELKLQFIDAENMKELHTRFARWVRETPETIENVRVQPDVAEAMRAFPDPTLPPIECVIRTPLFGRTGRLICTPGYHPQDHVFLDPNCPILPVSEIPTAQEVQEAISLILDELLVDFAFENPRDKAHAFVMVLTPFFRRMVDGMIPLHLIEAPKMGTGKSELANCVQIIATGREPYGHTVPNQDEELKKLITTILQAGDPINLFDNLGNRKVLASEHLAAMATRHTWHDRVLGFTREIVLPNKALWVLTANNPRLSGELLRRCVRIRLDARTEHPWSRTFKHPFPDWPMANRPRLVWACLTVIQHWIVSGEPRFSGKPLGSFRNFSLIGGGLSELYHMPQFLEGFDKSLDESDEEGEQWREFFEQWWEAFHANPRTVQELNEFCEAKNLLIGVRGDKGDRSQQTRLGGALGKMVKDIYSGLQIRKNSRGSSFSERKATYFLERLDENNHSPNAPEGDHTYHTSITPGCDPDLFGKDGI